MSGVLKSVGKVFKKVVKTVTKVAPYVLAAGAMIYTAGAALGAGSIFAGGWGGAVSSAVSSMGGSGLLGNVLTGALTQAGYGAIIGGATSALTGGSFSKGLKMGALGGAVTGGISGGLGFETDPLKGIGQETPPVNSAGNRMTGVAGMANTSQAPANAASQAAAGSATVGPIGSQTAVNPTPSSGLLGWAERNQTLLGNVISGVGGGLLKGQESADYAEALKERDQAQRDYIAGNYATNGSGLLTQGDVNGVVAAGNRNPTPSQRFDPRTYSGQYVYDPAQGRIVFVPNQTA